MAFVIYPSNIDYMIDNVRLRIGDMEGTRYSDSLIRTSILGGIKMLQKRWHNRYLVFEAGTQYNTLPVAIYYELDYDALLTPSYQYIVPSGYWYVRTPNGDGIAPSGLLDNDVFRNPYHTFISTGLTPVSQEDEHAVVLASSISLGRTRLMSSADSFMSWSDGEYSFSNIQSGKALNDLLNSDLDELNLLFKRGLSGVRRSSFDGNMLIRY